MTSLINSLSFLSHLQQVYADLAQRPGCDRVSPISPGGEVRQGVPARVGDPGLGVEGVQPGGVGSLVQATINSICSL